MALCEDIEESLYLPPAIPTLPSESPPPFSVTVCSVDPPHAFDDIGSIPQFNRPLSWVEIDEQEREALFCDQSLGIIDLSSEQVSTWLNQYWTYFHPSFPIIHRSSLNNIDKPPSPMLQAAMLAIGMRYSSDAAAWRKSRIVLDRCLKLLEKVDISQIKSNGDT